MKGNFHVQFLGEGVAATSPPYPTLGWATTQVYPARNSPPCRGNSRQGCRWCRVARADADSQVSALGVGLPSGGPFPVRARSAHRKRAHGQQGLRAGANLLGRNLDGNQIAGVPNMLSGDTNSDPPPTCTDPHSHHAFVLSVIDAAVWLFLGFHLRFSLGLFGVDVCQPRSDQSTLALLTQSVTLPRDHQRVTVVE